MNRKKIFVKSILIIFFIIIFGGNKPIFGGFGKVLANASLKAQTPTEKLNRLKLDEVDLLTMSKNGMVTSMCFVYEMLTGNFSRIIITLFVVGWGCAAMMSGKIDPLSLIPIFVAVALIFGGVELANIISGNTLSCASIKSATEKEDNKHTNEGLCFLNSLDSGIYDPEQQWRLCSQDNTASCGTDITSKTFIGMNDIISLRACKPGFYMETGKQLKYKCDGTNWVKMAGSSNTIPCKMYCHLSSLKNFLSNNKAIKLISGGETEEVINSSSDSNLKKVKLLSGELVENNKGFSDGAVMEAVCDASKSKEFGSDNELITPNDDGTMPDGYDGGVRLTCKNGNIIIKDGSGSCKENCSFSSITSKYNPSSVGAWKLCEKNETDLSKCADVAVNSSYKAPSEHYLQAMDCKANYEINHESEKIAFICSSGIWSIKGGETLANKKNIFCEKPCLFSKIKSAGYNVEVFGEKKKLGADWLALSDPQNNLEIKYYTDDYLKINSCESGFVIKADGRCAENVEPASFVCENGSWKNSNDGEVCHLVCNSEDIKKIGEELKIAKFRLFSSASNNSACSNVNEFNRESGALLYNGEHLRGSECENGYGIANINNLPYYKCNANSGKLIKTDYNNKNLCKKVCKIEDIPTSVSGENIFSWKKCNSSGKNCDDTKNFYSANNINYGESITIKDCNSGYSLDGEKPIKFICDETVIKGSNGTPDIADSSWKLLGADSAKCVLTPVQSSE
jgi:type IV secretory pathway VirB2 component (pilin)